MALLSSALKTKLETEIKALYGATPDDPAVLEKFAKAVAKAVCGWISAGGTASVTTIGGSGSTSLPGTLAATDDL